MNEEREGSGWRDEVGNMAWPNSNDREWQREKGVGRHDKIIK